MGLFFYVKILENSSVISVYRGGFCLPTDKYSRLVHAVNFLFPFSANCLTISGEPCVKGPWIWSEGPGIVAHYVNCIPMTAEG